MSQSLWCDKGDHSFSANDLDRQHFTRKRTVQVPTLDTWGRSMFAPRQEVEEELDHCGPCSATEGLLRPTGEIESAEKESEVAEAEMWKAKYEALKEHNDIIRLKPEP